MNEENFLKCVKNYEIPKTGVVNGNVFMTNYKIRYIITNYYCMWSQVSLDWTKELSTWIGDRSVIEVMAGVGWLAKALGLHGTRVTATDSNDRIFHTMKRSNQLESKKFDIDLIEHEKKLKQIHDVIEIDAVSAVKEMGGEYDILLVSWPPYSSDEINKCCEEWGKDKPIIYVGEGDGGCNADPEFFDRFRFNRFNCSMCQWAGIHDTVLVGEYCE